MICVPLRQSRLAVAAALVAGLSVGCGRTQPEQPRPEQPSTTEGGADVGAESAWRQDLKQAQALARALRRDEAMAVFESIEERAQAADESVIALEAVLGQSDVLREASDVAAALERLEIASQRAGALEDPDQASWWTARVLRQRAQSHSRAGDSAAAEADLARAAELYSGLDELDELAGVDATRSVLAAQTGRLEDAVTFGRRALDRLGDRSPTAESLAALSAVAYGLQQLQRPDEALAAYEQLIHGAWQRNDQRLVLFAYCNRAEILQATGALSESESDLRAAVARIEAERLHQPTGPDARSAALERQVAAYDRLIRRLVDSYRSDEAFALTERFRARAFLDLLAAAGSGDAGGAVPPTDSEPPGLEQLQGLLADGQALVSYWLLDDRLLAWVLTRPNIYFVQVPTHQDALTAEVMDYLEELRSPRLARTAALADTESHHLDAGLRLHRQLVGSLPKAARDARELLVVSDGVLHYLPLEALPTVCAPDDSDGVATRTEAGSALFAAYESCHWLGLEQAVSHLPSAAVLAELRHRGDPPAADERALILAPSVAQLDSARREARQVEALLPGSRRVEGAAATEAALSSANSYRYLHFASHGRIEDGDPLASGIELSPAGGDDGLLQAQEVLGLDLRSRLVTIAACRSGRGVLRRGEGLVGLTRAFLAAGAQSVVVSLWDVDDEASAELMAGFYAELAADQSPAEALRRARGRLARLRTERPVVFRTRRVSYAHPSYWAPYVVVGSG